jgi:hypothetical protein
MTRLLRLSLKDLVGHKSRSIQNDAVANTDLHREVIVRGEGTTPMQRITNQVELGRAKLWYRLSQIQHGTFKGKPACLVIIDFNFNYDKTCSITNADIVVTFGSKLTEKPASKPVNEIDEIVPFATDLRWPRKATGPSSNVHLSNETRLGLKFGFEGFSIETPESTRGKQGEQTDSGWRITGGPIEIQKPVRSQRGYLWRISGNDFNNYPVPEDFSLGMIVQHNMVDFWIKVKIKGALRGILATGRASVKNWRQERPRLWRVQPKEGTPDLNEMILGETMKEKYEAHFEKFQFGD